MKGSGGRKTNRAGFSLVELLMVVAIILLLAAIAVPRYLTAQQKAYEASAVSFLRTLQTEQEAYRLATGSYASNFQQLGLYARGPQQPPIPFAEQEMFARAIPVRAAGPNAPVAMLLTPVLLLTPEAGATEIQEPDRDQPGKTKRPKSKGGSGGGLGTPDMPGGGSRPGKGPARGSSGGGDAGDRPPKSGVRPFPNPSQDQPPAPPKAPPKAPPQGGGAPPSSGGGTPPSSTQPGSGPSKPLNVVVKHNFVFTLNRTSPTSYDCQVAPIRDRGFSRFFYMDQSGIIRTELGKPAGPNSPAL